MLCNGSTRPGHPGLLGSGLLNFAQGFSPVPSLFGASVPLGFRIAFAYLRYFTTIQPFVNLFLLKNRTFAEDSQKSGSPSLAHRFRLTGLGGRFWELELSAPISKTKIVPNRKIRLTHLLFQWFLPYSVLLIFALPDKAGFLRPFLGATA